MSFSCLVFSSHTVFLNTEIKSSCRLMGKSGKNLALRFRCLPSCFTNVGLHAGDSKTSDSWTHAGVPYSLSILYSSSVWNFWREGGEKKKAILHLVAATPTYYGTTKKASTKKTGKRDGENLLFIPSLTTLSSTESIKTALFRYLESLTFLEVNHSRFSCASLMKKGRGKNGIKTLD